MTTPETPADAQPRFCRCGVNAWTKTEDGFRCADCGAAPMTPASVDGGPVLLPCPFCGGAADVVPDRLVPTSEDHVYVMCKRCEVYAPEGDETWTTRAEKAAAWNRRPTTARDAALREEGRVQGLEEAAKACESLGTELSSAGDRADWDDREECMAERIRSRKPAHPDTSQGSALDQPAIVVCEDCEEDYSFQCDLCGDRFCGEHATQHKADKCPALAAASQGSALVDGFADGWRAGLDALAAAASQEDTRVVDLIGSMGGAAVIDVVAYCALAFKTLAPPAAPQGSPPWAKTLVGELAEALRGWVEYARRVQLGCGTSLAILARYDATIPQEGRTP